MGWAGGPLFLFFSCIQLLTRAESGFETKVSSGVGGRSIFSFFSCISLLTRAGSSLRVSGVGGRPNFFLYFFKFRCLLCMSRVKFQNGMVSNGVGGRTTFFFFFLDFVTYTSRADFQNEMVSSGWTGGPRFSLSLSTSYLSPSNCPCFNKYNCIFSDHSI